MNPFRWLLNHRQIRWDSRLLDDSHVNITSTDWLKRLKLHEDRTAAELVATQRPTVKLPPSKVAASSESMLNG